MNIGEKLKLLRESNNMTRKDAADELRKFGINISDKTIYGYESGRNSANADMFLALCRIYKCNNIMETFSDSVDDILFTNIEWNMIEKYRDLDPPGKELVDYVLNHEHKRCTQPDEIGEKSTAYRIRPVPERFLSNLDPVAAHNDDLSEEQQELMKRDLDEL